MIFFSKLLFGSLRGIDPLVLPAAICLGLGGCFVMLFVELGKVRARWRDNAMKRRSQAQPSPVVSELRRRDRQN